MRRLALLAVLLAHGGRAHKLRVRPAMRPTNRANRLFVAGKYQESFNAVDEALKLDPKLVPALTLKAKLSMAANRYDVARASLEQAIAADPSSWYAQFLYGFQFYQQNELPAANAGAGEGVPAESARCAHVALSGPDAGEPGSNRGGSRRITGRRSIWVKSRANSIPICC